MCRNKRRYFSIELGLLLILSACSSPVARLHDQATQFGFQIVESVAAGFTLTSFKHLPASGGKRLHVYLEGDGRPWESGLFPAADPTTHASVILKLMALDPSPALYLGRPCYNGHAGDQGCTQNLWTGARYGERVLRSMTQAIIDFCGEHGYRETVLIGHSGGGTLALLLAERLRQTVAVVTLAGNYDIDTWADHHGYQRLSESLNPATRNDTGILEWHLLGKRDSNIPPDLFQEALQRRRNSHVQVVDADHSQGWQAIWPQMLQRLEQLR